MTLKRVNAAFLAAIANPICQLAILPKEAVEDKPINKADIVGTGPYKFVEWIPDRWVRVVRFADYRPEGKVDVGGLGGARHAYADEIRFIPVPEPGARVAGLQTGEYDFADFLPSASMPQLTGDRSLRVVRLGPQNYPTVYFNHTGKFKNLKLRQAVQAALNMDEIMQVANDGDGRVDPGFYFKEQVWHTTAGGKLYNQKNPAKAKQLLQEAGYKGEPVVFVTNTSYDYMYKAAQVIQEQLKKIGMNVTLGVYDWPGSLAVRKDMGKWDMFTSSHSTRFDPNANDFYFRAKTTFFGYENPKMESPPRQGQRGHEVRGSLQDLRGGAEAHLRGRDHVEAVRPLHLARALGEAQRLHPLCHGAVVERVAGEVGAAEAQRRRGARAPLNVQALGASAPLRGPGTNG